MLRSLLNLHDALTRLTFWLAVAAVFYLTAVTGFEVVGRYVFKAPTDWAPDTSAVAFAYITFLAAPMITWKSGHAAMTVVTDTAPPSVALFLKRVSLIVAALTCGLCGYYGAVETARQIKQGVTMITVTPIPKWTVTGVIVYGLISMALYFLRQFAATFARNPIPNDGDAAWNGTFS